MSIINITPKFAIGERVTYNGSIPTATGTAVVVSYAVLDGHDVRYVLEFECGGRTANNGSAESSLATLDPNKHEFGINGYLAKQGFEKAVNYSGAERYYYHARLGEILSWDECVARGVDRDAMMPVQRIEGV